MFILSSPDSITCYTMIHDTTHYTLPQYIAFVFITCMGGYFMTIYSLFIFVMIFFFFAFSLAGLEPMNYCSAIPCYNLVCHLVAHYVIAMYIAGHSDAV